MQLEPIQSIQKLDETVQFMTNQIAPSSKRIYESHLRYFNKWLVERGLNFFTVQDTDLAVYRSHLLETHAKKSASGMLTVVKLLYTSAFDRELLSRNPAKRIKGIKADTEHTPYRTLTISEAKTILDSINTSKLIGMRDYMVLAILIRTGMRRESLASLTTTSISTQSGQTVLTYLAKGNRQSQTVLPKDVVKKLNEYMKRANISKDKEHALFFSFTRNKGDNLSGNQIALIVKKHSGAADLLVTPHCLRATFITGALASGASLHKVQIAVNHKDSRTTWHYATDLESITDHAGLYFPEI